MSEDRPPSAPGASAAVRDAITGSALGLLLSGGICLYFGLTLVADAPGSANTAEAERWFAADNALFWSLRGIGVLFLVAAALAAAARPVSMLLATIAETGFAVLMVVMTVDWTLEARADGLVNYQIILLLILAIVGVSAARSAWKRWQVARLGARPPSEPDSERP
jgi:hypothetical protein